MTPATWRAMRRGDAPALLETRNAAERADRLPLLTPLFDLEAELDDADLDLARDGFVAGTTDGVAAAWGYAKTRPDGTPDGHFAYLDARVHPDHRGRGLGGMLLDRLVARGREQLIERADGATPLLRQPVFEWQGDARSLLESRGFTPLRWFVELACDVRGALVDAALPAGITLAPWTAQRDAELHALDELAFDDHWGHTPTSYERWRGLTYGNPRFRDDLSLVAEDADGTAVGLLLAQVYPEDWEATGRREAWIASIAVAPRWRRRGVAAALIAEALHRVKADGLDYGSLSVDSASPTGAHRLYERMGFAAAARSVTYALPVAAQT